MYYIIEKKCILIPFKEYVVLYGKYYHLSMMMTPKTCVGHL